MSRPYSQTLLAMVAMADLVSTDAGWDGHLPHRFVKFRSDVSDGLHIPGPGFPSSRSG
jgi:hypothetical protein